MNLAERLGRGVYDADRAAALAGVPKPTLYYWARKKLYVPSIAPEPRTLRRVQLGTSFGRGIPFVNPLQLPECRPDAC